MRDKQKEKIKKIALQIVIEHKKTHERMVERDLAESYQEIWNKSYSTDQLREDLPKHIDEIKKIGILDDDDESKEFPIPLPLDITSILDIIDNYFDLTDPKYLAIEELKGWKEKLDLELISQEEYDKHKKRLSPIIIKE